jgi:hypothetical protein
VSEILRLVLLFAVAGTAATGLIVAIGWYMAEHRRLARAFVHVLGEKPDAAVIAHGHGRGAALSLATGRLATAWDSGAWCLVYGLEELIGAEVALDGQVAARVLRGETRKGLDRSGGAVDEVTLRLLFDDPLHPDFDLPLWPAPQGRPGAPTRPPEAVSEANRWLGRVEAVLRRTGAAIARPAPAPPPKPTGHRPLTEDLFDLDEEESPV